MITQPRAVDVPFDSTDPPRPPTRRVLSVVGLPLPTGFVVLRHRNFALYWSSQLISFTGTWMQILATVWLLYQLTGSALLTGLNGLFQSLPILTLSHVGGAVADRVDRRALVVVTQLGFALLSTILGTLVLLGQIRPWEVYLASTASAVVAAFDAPARQALLPALVPPDEVEPAVLLTSFLWRGARLVGPAIAAVIISLLGLAGAFYANGVTFLVVVLALLAMRGVVTRPRYRPSPLWDQVREGFAYVQSHAIVRTILILEGIGNVLGDDVTMLTLFAGQVYHVGPSGLGLLTSSLGAGAIVGSIALAAIGEIHWYGRVLLASSLSYALALTVFGLSRSLPVGVAILFVVGAADAIWSVARSAALQLVTPDQVRGRVMGLLTLATRGLGPLGQLETGSVAQLLGTPAEPMVSGMVILMVTAWVGLRHPRFWRFRV